MVTRRTQREFMPLRALNQPSAVANPWWRPVSRTDDGDVLPCSRRNTPRGVRGSAEHSRISHGTRRGARETVEYGADE